MPPAEHNKPMYEKKSYPIDKAFVSAVENQFGDNLCAVLEVNYKNDANTIVKRMLLIKHKMEYLNGRKEKDGPSIRMHVNEAPDWILTPAFANRYHEHKGNVEWHEAGGWKKELAERKFLKKKAEIKISCLETEVEPVKSEFGFAADARNAGSPFRTEQERLEYQLGIRPDGKRKR